ncbi:hypothetical protein ACJX0J_012186, partial [Zea mays]
IAWNSAIIGVRKYRKGKNFIGNLLSHDGLILSIHEDKEIIKGDILAAAMAFSIYYSSHLGFEQIWCDIVSNLLASASGLKTSMEKSSTKFGEISFGEEEKKLWVATIWNTMFWTDKWT